MNSFFILNFVICAIVASTFADPTKESAHNLGSNAAIRSKDKVMMLQGQSSSKLMGSGENNEGSQSGGGSSSGAGSSDGMRQNNMNSNGNRNGGRRSRLRNRLCGGMQGGG